MKEQMMLHRVGVMLHHIPFPIHFLIVALAVTIYVVVAKNPFKKGTNEYQSLRLCRIGLAFLFWAVGSFPGFSPWMSLPLALVALILGIIGIVKGRTLYGIIVIIGSVLSLPLISMVVSGIIPYMLLNGLIGVLGVGHSWRPSSLYLIEIGLAFIFFVIIIIVLTGKKKNYEPD
jgi:hypothetical protein